MDGRKFQSILLVRVLDRGWTPLRNLAGGKGGQPDRREVESERCLRHKKRREGGERRAERGNWEPGQGSFGSLGL